MEPPSTSAGRIVIGLAATVILLAGMRQAAPILAPLLLGLLVAVILVPLQRHLETRTGKVPAFLLSLMMMLAAVIGFAALLGLGAWALSRGLVQYAYRSDFVFAQVNALLDGVGVTSEDLIGYAQQRAGTGIEVALRFAVEVLSAAGDFTLMLLLLSFVLADAMRLGEKAHVLNEMTNRSAERVGQLVDDVRRFLKVTGIIGVINGVLATAYFFILGVDLAVLWGVIIFVMSFVPYVGFWLALVPPTVLAALEYGLFRGVGVLIGMFVISAVVSNILKPKLLSDGLDLSPFTVVFSVVLWAFVLGPIGAILAVPLTMLVREMVVAPDPVLGWLAMLMGRRARIPDTLGTQMGSGDEVDR